MTPYRRFLLVRRPSIWSRRLRKRTHSNDKFVNAVIVLVNDRNRSRSFVLLFVRVELCFWAPSQCSKPLRLKPLRLRNNLLAVSKMCSCAMITMIKILGILSLLLETSFVLVSAGHCGRVSYFVFNSFC